MGAAVGTQLASRRPDRTLGLLARAGCLTPTWSSYDPMRMAAAAKFPRAALSRGVAGTRKRTLIVNLPGSPGGVRDGLAVLETIAEHAVGVVRGAVTTHD